MTERELLRECLKALNTIPNRVYHGDLYAKTYDLAAAIEAHGISVRGPEADTIKGPGMRSVSVEFENGEVFKVSWDASKYAALVPGYWDCSCDTDFVHSDVQKTCKRCREREIERPEALLDEFVQVLMEQTRKNCGIDTVIDTRKNMGVKD